MRIKKLLARVEELQEMQEKKLSLKLVNQSFLQKMQLNSS